MNNSKAVELFEKAPVSQAVLKNALPAMAAMLMVLIYNLADTFFIGQTHDALQVAAVSLAMPVFLMFMAVGTVFGMGGTSVISRALGQGRTEYAKKVCSFCMWGCVVIGVVMSALFLIFMDEILSLVGASPDTWDYAKSYLTIVSLGGPFVLISNCYSNVVRAEGRSSQAMMGQIIGNLLNVVLDPIMILGFGWNIAGAAIATVIGNVAGALYYILYFAGGKSIPILPYTRYKGRKDKFHPWDFTYDPEHDSFQCPKGQPLRHTTTSWDGKRTYRSTPKICRCCPCRQVCGANEKGQRISLRPSPPLPRRWLLWWLCRRQPMFRSPCPSPSSSRLPSPASGS